MTKLRIYRSSEWNDWEADCELHGETMTSGDWMSAMEWAMGHICMWHGEPCS